MNKYAIYHRPDSEYAYPLDKNTLRLVLKTARGERLKEVGVLWNNKYDFSHRRYFARMRRFCSDDKYDYYISDIESGDVRFAYIFLLTLKNGEELYFSEEGVTEEYDFKHGYYTFFQFPYINEADVITPPPWTKGAIFYQIFPDRFARGDFEKDDTYITQEWDAVPKAKDFAGGDLKGIEGRLDEIRDMGFNALYLTPVFRSPSNHKYNITDYLTVDPMFGTNEDLYDLIGAAHARGMKIVLDAVFNHCDESHAFFADVKEKGRGSEYFDWFIIHGERAEKRAGKPSPWGEGVERSETDEGDRPYVIPNEREGSHEISRSARNDVGEEPCASHSASAHPERSEGSTQTKSSSEGLWDASATPQHERGEPSAHPERSEGSPSTQLCNYEIFADCPYMPKWNTSNPKVQEYLIRIALTYLSWGVDGLRLDVADEVSHAFWRRLRRAVKEKYPEALLLGEIWHENGMYLGGDEFDGVMDYKLQKVYTDYFATGKADAAEAADRINRIVMGMRRQETVMMLNFLDDHDTPRFLRMCGEDVGRLREALEALYFTAGMPCVFYGTELPLTGDGDPDCRRTYDGGRLPALRTRLKELAEMRRELPGGDFHAEAERGRLVLVREDKDTRVRAGFGRNGKAEIKKEQIWDGRA